MSEAMSEEAERKRVIALDAKRKEARNALVAKKDSAQEKLAPSAFISRWKSRQARRFDRTMDKAKDVTKQSAPYVGGALLGVLLFLARKPILKGVRKLRERKG